MQTKTTVHGIKTRRLRGLLSSVAIGIVLAGPMAMAADGVDKLTPPKPETNAIGGVTFGEPFIDVDEWRQTPRPHRYIHGGFKDSHLLFSIYLPPKELYKERFLLELEGGQGGQDKMMVSSDASMVGAPGGWAWAYDLAFDDMGAYLVETNEGHFPNEGLGVDNAFHLWQASIYATKYARLIAKQVYGSAPKHGYVNGCSGGGLRSAVHLENAPDVIDGAVPQAWGVNQRPNWSIYGLVGAVLGDKIADVIDAAEVGGSGDIYKGLSPRQSEALRNLMGLGWPRQATNQMRAAWPASPFSVYNVMDQDPTYYQDFWTKPGYLGRDTPAEVKDLLVDTTLTVTHGFTMKELTEKGFARSAADTATFGAEGGDILQSKPAASLDWTGDPQKLFMATATILTGPDAGKKMLLSGVASGPDGARYTAFTARAPYGFNNVRDGDRIRIDNRDWIAYLYYHRYGLKALTDKLGLATPGHQLMFPEHRAMEKPDGSPSYVQRNAATGWYPGLNGNFKGKMIMLSGLSDEPIWPTQMTPYEHMVRRNLGANVDNQYRFWWLDHTPHCSGPLSGERSTYLVPNNGVVRQAILDVMRWVEDGKPPAADMAYRYSADNALIVPATAKERGGIQPVTILKANGAERAEVKVGQSVRFDATADAPPGSGAIVRAQFDFDGKGAWPVSVAEANGASGSLATSATHAYDKPGTYFASFRVASHRDGAKGKGPPIYNLARVRVVVK
jgi:hypothetical protein